MENNNTTTGAAMTPAEKMREKMTAMENAVATILAKGENMTDAERMTLLSFVNIALHNGGKIDGCASIDSATACGFCVKMLDASLLNLLMICGGRYAAADAKWKEAARRRHEINMRIFSAVLFTPAELATLNIPSNLCRFNEDGDTANETMARNYLRIAATHPGVNFGYWYKNAPDVEKGLISEGYTTRGALPRNVHFIHSSALIGFPARPLWFDDAIFTVYPDAETTEKAIENGAHECNGRRCKDCGYTCYKMPRRSAPLYIAEILRTNKEKRAAIRSAYDARAMQGRNA